MPEDGAVDCCRCCFSFILTSGLTALFLWLSLRTSAPTCSVQRFDVPQLNRSAVGSRNRTIDFDLKLDNGMKDKGVGYGDIVLSFSFYLNNDTAAGRRRLPIGKYSVPGFNQGHGKDTHRRVLVNISDGMPWQEALSAVSNGSTADFRVDLETRVKYKIVFWYTNRRSLAVGADVAVDGSGEKVEKKKKKGIKMKSWAARRGRGRVISGVVFTFVVILLLS